MAGLLPSIISTVFGLTQQSLPTPRELSRGGWLRSVPADSIIDIDHWSDAMITEWGKTSVDKSSTLRDTDPERYGRLFGVSGGGGGDPESPAPDSGSPSALWEPSNLIEGGEHASPIGAEDYFVPGFIRSIPGGAAGFAQQTPAGQRQMFGGNGNGAGTRRARKRRSTATNKRSAAASRPRKKRAAARGTKFTKGSAAAKAHMKRLRAMRK